MFLSRNLLAWRHLLINSDLVFRVIDLSAVMIKYFSHRHSWQRLETLEYEFECLRIDHVMLKSMLLSLSFQTCLLSAVCFLLWSSLNDDL